MRPQTGVAGGVTRDAREPRPTSIAWVPGLASKHQRTRRCADYGKHSTWRGVLTHRWSVHPVRALPAQAPLLRYLSPPAPLDSVSGGPRSFPTSTGVRCTKAPERSRTLTPASHGIDLPRQLQQQDRQRGPLASRTALIKLRCCQLPEGNVQLKPAALGGHGHSHVR
jgi:hypothetical protein